MSEPNTYGELIKSGLRKKFGTARFSIRAVARDLGYSYEHVRKVLQDEPVASEDFNRRICEYLQIDRQHAWQILVADKRRRFPALLAAPADERFKAAWELLSRSEQEQLLVIAETMAKFRRDDR